MTSNKCSDLLHECLVLFPCGRNVIEHKTHADVADIRLYGSKFTGSQLERFPRGFNLALTEPRAHCCSRLVHSHFNADDSTRHHEHEIRLLTLVDFIG